MPIKPADPDSPPGLQIPCLTLTEPWASFVILGEKCVETRSWKTDYRGPLAIHAAKTMPQWARDVAWTPPIVELSIRYGLVNLWNFPLGCLLGVVDLIAVVKTEKVVNLTGNDGIEYDHQTGELAIDTQEHQLGDYADGRYAWILANPRSAPENRPETGHLGLWPWDVPDEWVAPLKLEAIRERRS